MKEHKFNQDNIEHLSRTSGREPDYEFGDLQQDEKPEIERVAPKSQWLDDKWIPSNHNPDHKFYIHHDKNTVSEFDTRKERDIIFELLNNPLLKKEDFTPDKPINVESRHAFFICRAGKDLFEYKTREERDSAFYLYNDLSLKKRDYTPDYKEVIAMEREQRSRRNFENCW